MAGLTCALFLASWIKFAGAVAMLVGVMTHNWAEIDTSRTSLTQTFGLFKYCDISGNCDHEMEWKLRGRSTLTNKSPSLMKNNITDNI